MKIKKNMISVIMSNYNTPEKYLRASIDSILNQTYKNFEFIIIDDGSTDDSLSIIESYSDDRITIVRNNVNLGITKSLNKGLTLAKGEFVARMDSDDISAPTRFETQVEFLKSHKDCIVCGTGIELIGNWEQKHSDKYICRTIPPKEEFQINLLFGNCPNIVHPTAMFNHLLLKKYGISYNEEYPLAQDYEMWVTCSKYAECANIPETLLNYRVHGGAVSSAKVDLQKNVARQIVQEQLNQLNIELTDEFADIHMGLLANRKKYDLRIKLWIKHLIYQNKLHNKYSQKLFKKILWNKWTEISYFALSEQKNIISAVKILIHIPIWNLPYLFKIKFNRRSKK